MKLYEIDAKMQELMEKWESCIDEDTGEILDDKVFDIEEELTKLELDRREKLENCVCYYKGLLAEAVALQTEEQTLAKRRKAAENRAKSLKEFIGRMAGGEKYKSPRMSISYRRNSVTQVNDMKELIKYDDSLVRYADPEPCKNEIKKLLKAGKKVPGCKLVYNTSVIIR